MTWDVLNAGLGWPVAGTLLVVSMASSFITDGKRVELARVEGVQSLDGILYMNNLPYFWGIENDELRGDPYDSVNEVERGRKARIFLQDGEEIHSVHEEY